MTHTKTTRRTLLRGSIAGAFGLALSGMRGASAEQAADQLDAVAKHLIVLWMNGGPSHVDTFDPKTGRDAGPFKSIDTRIPGVKICEHLPQLADQADKLAIVRSVTSKEGNHQRARYLGHTGYAPNPTVQHPSLGAWLSAERGSSASLALPGFISVGGPSVGGGFLGAAHAPFVIRKPGGLPQNVGYGFGVDSGRFDRRKKALDFLEQRFAASTADPSVDARRAVYDRAQRMMRSQQISAFDLDTEPQAVRDAYGDSDFGRGCLLARRLVETGAPVIEVALDGWDTHQNNFDRTQKLMNQLDPAMASLLRELDERDKLDQTLVLWMGEFGRSPRINGREGRDHHPRAWSAVLAGGGIRGGIVHGATDATGDRVADKPVQLPDLFATVAWQLGLDPSKSRISNGGRPISVTDSGAAIRALIA